MAKKTDLPTLSQLLGQNITYVEQLISVREREDALNARKKNFDTLIKSQQELVAQKKSELSETIYRVLSELGNTTDSGYSVVASDAQVSIVVKYTEQFSADHPEYGTDRANHKLAELNQALQDTHAAVAAEYQPDLEAVDARIAELQQARQALEDELRAVVSEKIEQQGIPAKIQQAQLELDALQQMQRKLGIVIKSNPVYVPTLKLK